MQIDLRGAARELVRSLKADPETLTPTPPDMARWKRILIGLGFGLWGFALTYRYFGHRTLYFDFFYPWFAARLLELGHSPYLAIPGGGAHPVSSPFSYPLPAVLLVTPLAELGYRMAGALFFGLSSAILAYLLARRHPHRLCVFIGVPYLAAASQGQWSPLMMAVALTPALGWLAVMKPNLGLGSLAYRPSWAAAIGCVTVLLLSLWWLPSWPLQWQANAARLDHHPAPFAHLLALPLALAVIRWRWPEARLLLVLASVPQLLYFYDQTALWLVPRTLRESLFLTAMSQAGALIWQATADPSYSVPSQAWPWVIGFCYIPALLIVLRRPAVPPGLARGQAS